MTCEVSQTETYSIGDYIKSGETAAVYFKPYYVRVSGTYNGGLIPISFTAYYPKLLDTGYADGIFYIVRE